MFRLSATTFDRLVRALICCAIIFSSLGASAPLPAAQANVNQAPAPLVAATPFASPVSTPLPLTPTAVPVPTSTSVATPPVTETPTLTGSIELTPTQALIGVAGGRLQSIDRRVQLDVPPGLLAHSTRLSLTPRHMPPTDGANGARFQFDLDAQDLINNTSVSTFTHALTLTVDLRGIFDPAQLKPYERLMIFHKTDNPDAPWAELNGTTEIASGVVRVRVTHFSTYAAGSTGNQPAGWHLKYNPPVTALFSGAMNYSYPIEVPSGRGGVQPNITLAYSSRSLDGLMSLSNEDNDGVPPGWALDLASISRNGIDTIGKYVHLPDRFSLAINGANYDLFPDHPTWYCGRYRAKDVPGLYIERRNASQYCLNGSANFSNEYWIVKTGDGTTYQFGAVGESEQTVMQDGTHCDGYCSATCPTGGWCAGGASRWRVDSVTDVYGNQLTVNYASYQTEDDPPPGTPWTLTEHTRPTVMRYNYLDSLAQTSVQFNNSTNASWNWIDRIRVYNAGETNLIREYQLTWDDVRLRLTAMTQFGTTGQSLPATSFTYTDLPHDYDQALVPYLTRVANGYGGATEFTYGSDNRRESSSGVTHFGYSYRVIEERTYDGLNSVPAKVQYAYGAACYDQKTSNVPTLRFCRSATPPDYGPVVGHDLVTRTVLGPGDAPVARGIHTFNIDDGATTLRGRELTNRQVDPVQSNNPLLTGVTNSYLTRTIGSAVFTYLNQETHLTSASGLTLTQTLTHTYDDYGNLVATYDTGASSSDLDDRQTTRGFYPTTTILTSTLGQWIVNKPGYTNVYTRVSATQPFTLAKSTWYSYDNRPQFYLPPITGTLTAVRAWTGTYPPQFVDTRYTYDGWGNRLTATTFDDLGTGSAFAALNPVTTTTTYDGLYHLYPVQLTNPKNQTVQTAYDYALGVPITVTDANGAVTSYQYDTFGRLLKVIGPGDTAADPSVQYGYSDVVNGSPFWVAPFRISESHKPQSGGPGVRHFYDGLGREIQTQGPVSVTVSGSAMPVDVLVTRRYDARGLLISQTVPYTVPAYVYNANVVPYTTTNLTAAPKTLTQYDALGRVITTTAPDGTRTIHSYLMDAPDLRYTATGLYLEAVVDANNHGKHFVTNTDGRLVVMRELSGTVAPRPLYAETKYAYDALGQLRIVTDALTNTTVITYDALGRKTDMLDPDMGQWTYQYDTAGNLITQTDAKGQTMTFTYDVLNRLTGKSTGVTYGYDVDPNKAAHIMAFKGLDTTSEMGVWDGNTTLSLSADHVEGAYAVRADTGTPAGGFGNYGAGITFSSAYRWWHVRVKPLTPGSWTKFWFWDATDSRWEAIRSLDGDANFEVGEDLQLNQWNELWLDTWAPTTAGDPVETPQNGTLHASPNSAFIWDDFYGAMPEVRYHVGQRTAMTDPSGWATWAYDTRGRVVSETKAISNTGGGTFVTQYGYDLLDRVVTTTLPTQEVITQTYNSMGALETMRSISSSAPYNGQWYATNLDYNANGSLALMQLGNSVNVTSTYAPLNFRLQRLQIGNIQAFNYGYDNVGNVLTLTTQITLPITSTETVAFKYDALDRLTNAVSVTNGYTGTYGYNAIGNLITKTESASPITYTYGVTQPHAVRSLTNGANFLYDLNGNMTRRVENGNTYTQTWDVENRLVTVTSVISNLPTVSRFVYDGDGARVLQVNISGTQVITMAYAGAIEVMITPTQRITKTYYSAGSTLIAMRQYTTPTSSVLYFLHSDHLGSTSLTTNASGAVVSRQLYDAWGNVRQRGTLPTDIGYTGQREDTSTNLMFYNARYYSPLLGRFLSADTIVPSAGNPQAWNRYSYSINNPLKYTDPNGHCFFLAGFDTAVCVGILEALGTVLEAVTVGAAIGAGAAAVASVATPSNAQPFEAPLPVPPPPSTALTIGTAIAGATAAIMEAVQGAIDANDNAESGSTLKPGEHAGKSIPASSPGRDFTDDERREINEIGNETGCHTCGSKVAGTKSGNFIPDHQPPSALNSAGKAQRLYPHCINCSRQQGGQVNRALRKGIIDTP